MAKVTEAAFIIAGDLAAVQLTTMLQDDTLTEVAADFKHRMHPARELPRFFVLDKDTGAVTFDSDYATAFYAGNYPQIPHLMNGNAPKTPLAVVSATIEDAAPANIVITFSAQLQEARFTSMAGAGVGAKTILSVTIVGAVMTITVSADFIMTDVVTVSSNVFGVGYNNLTLADEAITNNVL